MVFVLLRKTIVLFKERRRYDRLTQNVAHERKSKTIYYVKLDNIGLQGYFQYSGPFVIFWPRENIYRKKGEDRIFLFRSKLLLDSINFWRQAMVSAFPSAFVLCHDPEYMNMITSWKADWITPSRSDMFGNVGWEPLK